MPHCHLYLDHDTWVHRLHPLVRLLGMVVGLRRRLRRSSARSGNCRSSSTLVALLAWTRLARQRLPPALSVRPHLRDDLRDLDALLRPDGAPPLFAWGPITVSRTAPWFALGMALKLDCFLGSGILFLSVTRIEEFAYALTRARRAVQGRLHDDPGVSPRAGVRRRRCHGRAGAALSRPRLRER